MFVNGCMMEWRGKGRFNVNFIVKAVGFLYN